MQNVAKEKVFHVMLGGEILCLQSPKDQKLGVQRPIKVNWSTIDFVPYNRKHLATCEECLKRLEIIEKGVLKDGRISPLPPSRKLKEPRKQREPREKRLPVTASPPLVANEPPPQPVIPEVVAEVASKEEALEESPMEEIPPKVPKEKKYWFGVEIQ